MNFFHDCILYLISELTQGTCSCGRRWRTANLLRMHCMYYIPPPDIICFAIALRRHRRSRRANWNEAGRRTRRNPRRARSCVHQIHHKHLFVAEGESSSSLQTAHGARQACRWRQRDRTNRSTDEPPPFSPATRATAPLGDTTPKRPSPPAPAASLRPASRHPPGARRSGRPNRPYQT